MDHLASTSTEDVDEDITYDPTSYEKIGFRINTPPPDFWKDDETKAKMCHSSEQNPDHSRLKMILTCLAKYLMG